jgi:hypothetical protein
LQCLGLIVVAVHVLNNKANTVICQVYYHAFKPHRFSAADYEASSAAYIAPEPITSLLEINATSLPQRRQQ